MAVSFNGTSARSLGFFVEQVSPWRDHVLRYATAEVPRRQGATVLDPTPAEPTRDVTISGLIRGTSAADRVSKWNTVIATASVDPCKLVFDDNTSLELRTKLTQIRTGQVAAQMITRDLPVSLTFTAFDPYTYDTADQTVSGIGNSDVAIPLGTAPSRPVLTITGAATDPTITYKNSAGTTIQSMSFDASLSGGQTLVVDLDAKTVKVLGTLNLGALVGGQFFILDPIAHGNYATSSWPTLRCSSGTMACVYRRAYRG